MCFNIQLTEWRIEKIEGSLFKEIILENSLKLKDVFH
jgi:hypothetical protein